jgi:hypothetical protein
MQSVKDQKVKLFAWLFVCMFSEKKINILTLKKEEMFLFSVKKKCRNTVEDVFRDKYKTPAIRMINLTF